MQRQFSNQPTRPSQQPAGQQPSLYDESVFRILLDYEVTRSQRYVSPISLLRMALALGNPTPQEIKNAPLVLAALLNSRLRSADIPARVGNEFLVLLPATDESGGRIVCERFLRITPGTHTAPLGLTSRVAVCIGLASHPGGSSLNTTRLMQEAEAALKEARTRGTQTYVAYSDIIIKYR